MKKIIKDIVIVLAVALLSVNTISPVFALSESEYKDFADNESKYEKKCRNFSREDKAICDSFLEYKEQKIKRNEIGIKNTESVLTEIKGKIQDEEERLEGYYKEVDELQTVIIENEEIIEQTKITIEMVEEHIEEREIYINEVEDKIKVFLVNMQGEMRVNGYIEFIMGASSFSDIIRRTEGMKRIKEYNASLIEEVVREKAILETEKAGLLSKKVKLEEESHRLENQVKRIESIYDSIDKLVAKLRKEQKIQEELIEQSTKVSASDIESMRDIFQSIEQTSTGGASVDSIIESNGGQASFGWIYPVKGRFRVGDGVWGYDDGGKHLGQDFPATMGTPLVAPANGVILDTASGCSDNYNINDNCNGGWGNYLTMAVNVNRSYYGLLYAHIQQGGHLVSSGSQVSAGQEVALVGSSGKSSGPHLHVEVFYLGQLPEDVFRHYTTNTFGTGGSQSERPGSRCESNGGSAPCRMNPRVMFP